MNLMGRIWDMIWSAFTYRMTTQGSFIVTYLAKAEKALIDTTTDITQFQSVQLVVHGMMVAGLIVLAYCFVISLSELSTSAMLGGHFTLANWFWRLAVGCTMTFGSLPLYGRMIVTFNYLTETFRNYLDINPLTSTTAMYQIVLGLLTGAPLFVVIFVLVYLVFLVVLWFLMGGVRPAELAIYTVLAPITWPLYLIPSMEDIPKTAFRGFLGLQLLQLIVVGMLRLAALWLTETGWTEATLRIVPATGLIIMTVFLPTVIKRIVGQGHTGLGALTTAIRIATAVKGLQLLGAAGGAAAGMAAPPGATAPAAASGGSPYSLATVSPASSPAVTASPVYGAPGVPYQQAATAIMPPPPPPSRLALTDGGTGDTIRGNALAYVDGQPVDCQVLANQKVDPQELHRAAEAYVRGTVHDMRPPSGSSRFYGGGVKEE